MKILYDQQILHDLIDSTIFLDTNVFGSCARCEPFVGFISKLKNDIGCSFTTIPSVFFEFTNGSTSLDIYNSRTEFFNSLIDVINPVKYIDKIKDFSVVMSKINAQNKSYTDFLLAASLYNYRHAPVFLLTADLKALPKFFDRRFVITIEENSGDVRNFGLYSFNEESYLKAAQSVI